MKTAYFTYKSEYSARAIQGSVSRSNDGKIKISLFNAKRGTCAAERYKARQLGYDVVVAKFIHPAVTRVEGVDSISLVNILLVQTAELKKLFIQKTKKYAVGKYAWAVKHSKLTWDEWVEMYPEQLARPYKAFKNGTLTLIEKTLNRWGYAAKTEAEGIAKTGFEKFSQKEVQLAEIHYKMSIEKLADRLQQKGIINSDDFKITTARIGVNIETTIKHKDGKITKAWTIIAEGPIQRPHYRYLIK